MKYILLQGDGMPEQPLKALGGKTPLEASRTPNMDRLARAGMFGLVKTIPDGFSPGSDIGSLSLLGCDPKRYFTGRASIEAVSLGIKLDPSKCAFRCNLVNLDYSKTPPTMRDYSAGHITTDDARPLIQTIQEKLGTDELSFYPGVSYRHIMVAPARYSDVVTKPPHDIADQSIEPWLPKSKSSETAKFLISLITKSKEILAQHPVNRKRVSEGKLPANSIWLWGQGRAVKLPSLEDRFGISGGVISAVDLVRGVGLLVGLKIIEVPGITGYIDTNYQGKAKFALKALEDVDFVFLHVEAPDEAAHNGDIEVKIKAIEDFDSKIVGPVVEGMKKFKEYKILLCSDHQTLITTKTHGPEPVPFSICSSSDLAPTGGKEKNIHRRFSEKDALTTGVFIDKGHEILEVFLKGVPEHLQ